MKEIETIEGYERAEKNIKRLRISRMRLGISQCKLSQLSGVSQGSIQDYECGASLPTIRNYNNLCKVFEWKEITESTPHYVKRLKETELFPPEDMKLPAPVDFKFEKGHNYSILNTELGVGEPVEDCIFSYEGKQGIHHMFREVRGKWTRTYTDAQLVGKKIKEVI